MPNNKTARLRLPPAQLRSAILAALSAADGPLTVARLARVFELEPGVHTTTEEIRAALARLRDAGRIRRSGSGWGWEVADGAS